MLLLFSRIIQDVIINKEFHFVYFLPFVTPILMCLFSGKLAAGLVMFLWIETVASVHFGVVGVNAAHHHPEIFHDGDAPR